MEQKKDATLDGVRGVNNEHKPHGVSSDASNYNIPKSMKNVKGEQSQKGVISQSGVAPFVSKDGGIKATLHIAEKDGMRIIGANKGIDEDAFVEGLWDDGRSSKKFKIKQDIIDDVETTLKTKLGFVDANGQLTFIPTNVIITNTKVIAGVDVKNSFRDAKKYVDKYGGNKSDYRKIVGKIESAKYIFDIHFVKDKAGKEYDFKIKSKTLKEAEK